MKNIKNIILIPLLVLLFSCTSDEDYAPAEFEYVGFASSRLPSSVFEGGAEANESVVSVIFGNNYAPLRDIQVEIQIDPNSTAILGSDFVIEGASGQTFTVTIPADTAVGTFTIKTIPNYDKGEDRSLEFTILSASDGVRPGYPLDTKYQIGVVDDDCDLVFEDYLGEFQAEEPGYAASPYPVTFTADPLVENRVVSDNFWDFGGTPYYDFDPVTKVVTMPEQIVTMGGDDYTVEGSGLLDTCNGGFFVDYTVTLDGELQDQNTHTFTK